MGFKSCFRRFFPLPVLLLLLLLPLLLLPLLLLLDVTLLATCFALLMAAFALLSLPFMVRRVLVRETSRPGVLGAAGVYCDAEDASAARSRSASLSIFREEDGYTRSFVVVALGVGGGWEAVGWRMQQLHVFFFFTTGPVSSSRSSLVGVVSGTHTDATVSRGAEVGCG